MSLATDKPVNVIVVIADQLRRQALGTYGDPNVATPHLDALAAEGTKFTNASSTYPVCVPFRFSLMTGEYAHTRAVPAIEWRMSPAERTLADEFNDAGYHTAYFGKWHLYGGTGGVLPGHPTVKASRTPVPRCYRGRWQHFAGFELCNEPFDTVYFTDDDPRPHKIVGYQTDGLFDLALNYIENTSGTDRGYCCVVSVEPPHPPLTAPDEYLSRWSTRAIEPRPNFTNMPSTRRRSAHDKSGPRDLLDDLRAYYAAIENLDDNIGRLRSALSRTNQWQDTVVIVVSDHGDLLGSHGVNGKCDPHEESAGIPLLVAGAGVPAGRVVEDPVCTEDLFPTILGLAGLSPDSPKPGTDLTSLIRGDVAELDRVGVMLEQVSQFRPSSRFHDQTWRAFRTRDYKYAVLGDGEGGEPWLFYDLRTDPYELSNLVNDQRRVADMARMHNLLRDRMLETHDHYVLAAAHDQSGLNEWRQPVGTALRTD